MDLEKMKKWLEFTNNYQKNDFWWNAFKQQSPEQFFETFEKGENLPRYDIYKNDTHICIIIEIPGVSTNDINISLKSKTHLFIEGTIKPLFPTEMEVKKERYYGKVERLITLPEPTEAQFVQVNFHQGLIQVTYPRLNETLQVNEIM
ncbi:Hsp20/alpha crystallin family protein [Bacillus sp. 31A1R]|uniref:Hsp20/alpha crystallin family protein n=1 Tax=Robertmurraya mangrovi TaxID=3098077 RepID=A0ABU5IT10_9BACI|nr:Hsp20/alpha crystallin family protein [Bacillus sp. 31A1R]MDZ5470266.1 Hsp20/alpha crystallin family protein [Bacillus sp. 31A1R]